MAAHSAKLRTYTQLAADNSAVVTSGFENWSAFLVTAAKMYKYTFLEQLMIHIQRPQATACADYSTWGNEMRRYVRRYAKGIAVISFIDGQPTLRYVFDVADTGPKEGALYPFLWQNKDEYQTIIPAALEGQFQVPCDHQGLPVQLATIAAQLAGKYWTNGERKIIASIGDCPFKLTGETFQDATAASVTYSLLSRCGLHPEQFFDAEDFTSVYKLQRDFHFLFYVGVPSVHQELQAVVFLFQIAQLNDLWVACGPLHVVDVELGKVAGHDPAGPLGIGQFGGVAFGLLERGQQGTIRLLDGPVQIFPKTLLLNQNVSRRDKPINKAGMVKHDLIFKDDKLIRFFYTIDLLQQRKPEGLTVTFLVAFALPVGGKLFRGGAALCICHGGALLYLLFLQNTIQCRIFL